MHNHSSEYCKNCNQHLQMKQNFCPNCGQKSTIGRIDFHFLMHELLHGIFHVDGGIIFTLKKMFTEPGKSIREYLQGKRQAHFKPVLFVLIIGGLCSLLQHFVEAKSENLDEELKIDFSRDPSNTMKGVDQAGFLDYLKSVFTWVSEHFAFVILFLVPIAALGFYWGFRKAKIYYAEWLIYMCFSAGQLLVVYFFIIALEAIFGISLLPLFILISTGLNLWTLYQFLDGWKFPRVLIAYVGSITLYAILSLVIIIFLFIVVTTIGVWLYSK